MDFDLYSSLEDARNDRSPWQFCNGNDIGIGFPRDCGRIGPGSGEWTSFTLGGKNNYRYSVYRRQAKALVSCLLVRFLRSAVPSFHGFV